MKQEWYAIRVRSNYEQTTSKVLEARGYAVFAPTYREKRQWSDRTRNIDVPLFGGYIFCSMNIQQRLPVLQAPGVVNIVSFGKAFVPIPESEIGAIQMLLKSHAVVRPCPYLNVGEPVMIERGPLTGLEGILQQIRNERRLVLSVHLLKRSVAVEVNLEWVKRVNRSFQAVSWDLAWQTDPHVSS